MSGAKPCTASERAITPSPMLQLQQVSNDVRWYISDILHNFRLKYKITLVLSPALQLNQRKGHWWCHHRGWASLIHQKVQDSSQAAEGQFKQVSFQSWHKNFQMHLYGCTTHQIHQHRKNPYHYAAIVNDNFLRCYLRILLCNLTAAIK